MVAINAYVSREEFLEWITPLDTTPNYVEDVVTDSILEAVSRWIDEQTGRHFYPIADTHSFDIPASQKLFVEDDLLEVTTLTNGDDTTIASTEYILLPANFYPKYAIKLIGSTSTVWESDSNGNIEQVIDVLGFWGCHDDYARRGWKEVTTLAEALDDSETAWDLTDASTIKTGNIIKVDTELAIQSSKSSNTVTVLARGENGSTAAAHDNGATVYVWQPSKAIALACKTVATNIYRRFGVQAGQDENIVTASGVVITPRDVPTLAAMTIKKLSRIV